MEFIKGIDPRVFKYQDIKYNKQMGPDRVPNLETARRTGANCAAFAHLYNEEIHGWRLPGYLGPLEMWFEKKLLVEVDPGNLMRGDIAFFGRSNIDPRPVPEHIRHDTLASAKFMRKHQVPHIACIAGRDLETGEILFVHQSYAERGFAIWPESRFYEHRSTFGVALYEVLHAIKRPQKIFTLKVINQNTFNPFET